MKYYTITGIDIGSGNGIPLENYNIIMNIYNEMVRQFRN